MTRESTRAERRRDQRSDAPPSDAEPPAHRLAARRLLPPLLIVVAGLLAYTGSLQGAFVFDDRAAIIDNPTIRHPSWVLFPPFATAVHGRPVVNLSLALNYAIGGFEVESYHIFNLTIHLLAALVLFAIIRRTLLLPVAQKKYGGVATEIATAVALVWVVHPLTTESVTYVIQRTELMMGLCYLLTLYCLIRSAQSPRPRWWYAGVLGAFLLGLGCKEMIMTAPLVLVVYDRLFLSSSFADLWRRRRELYGAIVLLVLLGLFGARMRWGLRAVSRMLSGAISPWAYAETQCGVIVHYLRLAFWPHPLAADYNDWPIARSLLDVLPSALVIAALVGGTLWALHRRRPIAFLGVWFFAILAPTSSFLPLPLEVAAERRMYLPLAAVITLAVLGVHAALGKLFPGPAQAKRLGRAAAALVVAVAAILATLTVRRNDDYRTALAFWTAAVATRPNAVRARINLGDQLYNSGRSQEAAEHYAEAVRLGPHYLLAHYGLAVALGSQGKIDEAIEHYRQALAIRWRFAAAHNNLAILLERQGKTDEALKHYRAAVEAQPSHVVSNFNLGILLLAQGKHDDALKYLERVRRLRPDIREASEAIEEIRRTKSAAPPAASAP